MAKLTGGDRFTALLGDIDERTTRNVGKALFAAAEEIAVAAQISITTGSVSGKNHVPSRPGTPPNNDTGVLAGNIEAALVEPLKSTVTSGAPYAAIQEYGGTINHPGGTAYLIGDDGLARFVSNEEAAGKHYARTKPHTITLPERPYMRPALAEKRQRVRELIKSAIRAAIKPGAARGD